MELREQRYALLVCAVLLLAPFNSLCVDARQRYGSNRNEQEARQFLHEYYANMTYLCNKARLAEWAYETNISNFTQRAMIEAEVEESKYLKEIWGQVTSFDWPSFQNADIQRQLKLMSVIETAALPTEDVTKLKNLIASMTTIYSTTTVCAFKNKERCSLHLDPELTETLAKSRDYDELLHAWKEWHEQAGRPMRQYYSEYVKLNNQAAKLHGFDDMGEVWLYKYESETFQRDIEKIWYQVMPLYKQLHAYVRRKLINKYGNKIRQDGPIPAHLLGNMWAQEWRNIEDFVKPFPNKSTPDATPQLDKQQYTPSQMFTKAEDFFKSLGLKRMPDSFWEHSMFERPAGRDVICHASAWDFCDQNDVRIKMCTVVNMEDFITIHHEMGHIQYYLQYKDQPIVYRDGANAGFHEAVGDTLALSAGSSSHLHMIGLLPDYDPNDQEAQINDLFSLALTKIVFLPFGYLTDLWRWKVFKGEISSDDYNKEWWKLRKIYQGIEPAVPRSEDDFDPGSKYHVAADVEYIRYFVSQILQFQFHKALCEAAGQYVVGDPSKPLHDCDIVYSQAAGTIMSEMLKLGSSKPWTEVMLIATRGKSNTMDAGALLEYFQPLAEFLKRENEKNNEYIGWRDEGEQDVPSEINLNKNNNNLATKTDISLILIFTGLMLTQNLGAFIVSIL